MNRQLTWLDREKQKDKNEISHHKTHTIRDILNVEKKEITKGPLKIKKDRLWKRLWNKMKARYQR